MEIDWLTWVPARKTAIDNPEKTELTKPEITDKTSVEGSFVSFGSSTPQEDSIIHFYRPPAPVVVGEVSGRERRRATLEYLSAQHPIPPIFLIPNCTCREKPYPHSAHTAELALFDEQCKSRH
jgi:hypothetical protein